MDEWMDTHARAHAHTARTADAAQTQAANARSTVRAHWMGGWMVDRPRTPVTPVEHEGSSASGARMVGDETQKAALRWAE